jgi:transposase
MERTARLLNQLESTPEGFKAVATEDELGPSNHTAASCTPRGPQSRSQRICPREPLSVPGLATRACCGWRTVNQARRGHYRDPARYPNVLEGDPAHPGEVFFMPKLREDSQAPPFRVIARGWAGPSLLALVLFEKFGQH